MRKRRGGVVRRRIALLGCAALLAGAAACATGRGGSDSPFEEEAGVHRISVEVRNDRGPSGTLQIFIVTSSGSTELLGSLVGRGPRTFTYRTERPRAQHRLAARSSDGERFVSRPFVPGGARGVSWEVESNHLIRR